MDDKGKFQSNDSRLYFIIHICSVGVRNIQGVTGGTDQTSGECSLGQTIPI